MEAYEIVMIINAVFRGVKDLIKSLNKDNKNAPN